jgi:uncharacterized protein (DUF1697 family)
MHTNRFVAFLRGINVGGNKMVKMEELRSVFEDLGCTNVKTVLNSGNVFFETQQSSDVAAKIEDALEKTFSYKIYVVLRTINDIQALINSDPFNGITITSQTRLYVTFLANPPGNVLKIPDDSSEKDFKMLSVTKSEVCTVLTLSPEKNTTDLMKSIEKEFGKDVTTRSWNTILRIAKISS